MENSISNAHSRLLDLKDSHSLKYPIKVDDCFKVTATTEQSTCVDLTLCAVDSRRRVVQQNLIRLVVLLLRRMVPA